MRQVQVPSYRVRQAAEDGGPRRLLLMAGSLGGLLAMGGLIGWAVTRYTDKTIPVIQADSRPMKIRPEDRGGLRVANQDEIIFERRTLSGGYEPAGRLAPAAETPNLDALRAATAPPPPAGAPPAVVPAAPASAEASETISQPLEAAAPAPPPAVAPEPPPASPAAAKPAAMPAVAPPPPVRAAGGVVVQLGALDSEEGARAEWGRLERRAPELMQGRKPQVIRFEREGRPTMWRLRTNGFENHDAASSFCEAMKSRGGACAVIGG